MFVRRSGWMKSGKIRRSSGVHPSRLIEFLLYSFALVTDFEAPQSWQTGFLLAINQIEKIKSKRSEQLSFFPDRIHGSTADSG
jgi:hypothetical protein